MRYLKYLFLVLVGLCLLVLALANREMVTLRLLPEEMGTFLGLTWAVEMPLFIVVFLGVAAGLLIGFVWEWLREYKHRAAATEARREASRLEQEVTRLRVENAQPKDEVLALLEQPRKAG